MMVDRIAVRSMTPACRGAASSPVALRLVVAWY